MSDHVEEVAKLVVTVLKQIAANPSAVYASTSDGSGEHMLNIFLSAQDLVDIQSSPRVEKSLETIVAALSAKTKVPFRLSLHRIAE